MEVEKVAKVQRKQAAEKQKWADYVKAFLALFNRASNMTTVTVTTIATSAEARTTNPTTPSAVPTLTMTATATSSHGALNRSENIVTMATATAVPTIPAVAATMPPTPFTDDDGVEINYDDFECHDGDDLGNVSATMDGDAWRESDDP